MGAERMVSVKEEEEEEADLCDDDAADALLPVTTRELVAHLGTPALAQAHLERNGSPRPTA